MCLSGLKTVPFIVIFIYKVYYYKDEELENKFLAEAKAQGLIELKGHRIVGGCRASIYNGMPIEGVEKLTEFMRKFMENNISKL